MPPSATPLRPTGSSRPVETPRTAESEARSRLRLVVDRTAAPALRGAVGSVPKTNFGAADWLWSGLGIGIATASAGFAAYMLAFAPGEVTPSGNFNLFAHYDRRPRATPDGTVLAETAPRPEAQAAMPAATRADAASAGPVDFAPTGSIAAPAPQADAPRPDALRNPLTAFTLRTVFDGKALIESRSSLSVVKPGSQLDGAGQVLAIERRGGAWIVLTERGFIAGQRQ